MGVDTKPGRICGLFGNLPHAYVQFKRKHRIRKITKTPLLCGHPSSHCRFLKTLFTCCLRPGCLLVPTVGRTMDIHDLPNLDGAPRTLSSWLF